MSIDFQKKDICTDPKNQRKIPLYEKQLLFEFCFETYVDCKQNDPTMSSNNNIFKTLLYIYINFSCRTV